MDGKGKAKESTRTRSDWNAKIGANSPANRRQTAATRDTKEALMADDSIVCCENRFESWNGTRLSTIDNELSASHQRQVPFFFFWSLLLLFRSFRSFPSRSCVLHLLHLLLILLLFPSFSFILALLHFQDVFRSFLVLLFNNFSLSPKH